MGKANLNAFIMALLIILITSLGCLGLVTSMYFLISKLGAGLNSCNIINFWLAIICLCIASYTGGRLFADVLL